MLRPAIMDLLRWRTSFTRFFGEQSRTPPLRAPPPISRSAVGVVLGGVVSIASAGHYAGAPSSLSLSAVCPLWCATARRGETLSTREQICLFQFVKYNRSAKLTREGPWGIYTCAPLLPAAHAHLALPLALLSPLAAASRRCSPWGGPTTNKQTFVG